MKQVSTVFWKFMLICTIPISDIRLPISDVRYLYRTSDIYIGRPISISDIRYTRAKARARAGILDVEYRYRTSDIYIGRPIYIERPIYISDV